MESLQTIKYRHASDSDALQLITTTKQILAESDYLVTLPSEFTITVDDEVKWINQFRKREADCLIVATKEEKIIGSLSFLTNNSKKLRHTGELSMGLLKSYQNKGIGSRLLTYFFGYIEDLQLDFIKIKLFVFKSNKAAIRLYEKFGFQEEGVLAKEIYYNGYFHDIIIMAKHL